MSDPSSPGPLDPSDFPSEWVFWKDAVGPKTSGWKKIPPDIVNIAKRYVSIPRRILKLIGDPDRVSCYLHRFDMILAPAGEKGRRITKMREHYGRMLTITSKKNNLADLLKCGIYSYRVENLRGVPVLRILGCTSIQATHGYIEHWQESAQRLQNPNI